ncbi:MAG: OmpH family outer membrane protein [Akkermansiaceae bacterium]
MFVFRNRISSIALLWSLSILAVSAELKTMTVDVNKLYGEYHITKKAKEQLKSVQDAYSEEREERKKAITEVTDKLKDVIKKLRGKAMPESEKNNLREEYEELVSQYNALNKDFKESDRDKLGEIKEKIAIARRKGLDEITVVVKKFAKDNGYHWVMETSGVSNTQISPLVYAKSTEDKTDEVLKLLNKDAPKSEEKKDTEEGE